MFRWEIILHRQAADLGILLGEHGQDRGVGVLGGEIAQAGPRRGGQFGLAR